jgi:protein DJ-1
MRRALVVLSEGFEEIETSSIVDVLRRGGVEVTVAGLAGPSPISGSRGLKILPDAAFEAVIGPWDVIVLPGGMKNAEALAAHSDLHHVLRAQVQRGFPVAAICAAPLALDAAGVLPEGAFTCYPGIEQRLKASGRQDRAVVDAGTVITSQGPATSIAFALHLLQRVIGPDVEQKVARGLLYA